MPNQVQPIKPEEVIAEKARNFPGLVLESFNELITKNFCNGSAIVKQNDVIELMVKKGLNENEILSQGWIDVENLYRKAGWQVDYDKPASDEVCDAYFKFTTPRKKPL